MTSTDSRISIADALLDATAQLRRSGVPEPRREAGSLLAHALQTDRSFIITHADDEIANEQWAAFREMVGRRGEGEPLQYITGKQEFFGLVFEVSPAVLIPRPETELLVEAAQRFIFGDEPTLFCDVGTGSGCIAISLLHSWPNGRALALDVSDSALEVAARNAQNHNVGQRIDFLLSDCFREVPPATSFDLIVSNPPYVSEQAVAGLQREVRDYEPTLALTPGGDGLAIVRRLLVESIPVLKPQGYLLFEIGFDQAVAVRQLIAPNAWELLDILPDLQGFPRIVVLRKPN